MENLITEITNFIANHLIINYTPEQAALLTKVGAFVVKAELALLILWVLNWTDMMMREVVTAFTKNNFEFQGYLARWGCTYLLCLFICPNVIQALCLASGTYLVTSLVISITEIVSHFKNKN